MAEAKLIDGKAFAAGLRSRVAEGVAGLVAEGVARPGLATVPGRSTTRVLEPSRA